MNTESLNFEHMGETAISWFNYLNRQSESLGFSKPEDEPYGKNVFLTHYNPHLDSNMRNMSYLIDSLMVGLYTSDPIVALGCLLQAKTYVGKLKGYVSSYTHDALRELESQVRSQYRKMVQSHELIQELIQNYKSF